MLEIKAFFDKATFTLTYVVYDPASKDAMIIDPVWDYDPLSSTTSAKSVCTAAQFAKGADLKVHYILETHAHADHLSGSQELKKCFPSAKLAIGKQITVVQEMFKKIFALPDDFSVDGSQFDKLLEEGEEIKAGSVTFKVLFTPGHTPACASYLFEDALFTGDALFMPDYGTGRCDFPAGSATDLYHSVIRKLYRLPDATRVFVGHDYLPGGREMKYESTIGEQKTKNVQLPESRSEAEFVHFRTQRDSQLTLPRLIFQSVQVNINAGRLPAPASSNGVSYFKIPVNLKK